MVAAILLLIRFVPVPSNLPTPGGTPPSLISVLLIDLLGRSPGPEYLSKIESLARSVKGVLDVHGLRAEYIGPDTIHAGMHIKVRRVLSVEEANQIAGKVHRRVHEGTDSGYCFVQVDAAEAEG